MMTFTRYSIKIANPGFLEIVIITLGEIYHMSRNQFSAMNTIFLSLFLSLILHIRRRKQQHLQPLARQDKIKILVNGVEKTHFQIGIDVSQLERRQISRFGVVHTYKLSGFVACKSSKDQDRFTINNPLCPYIYILEIIPAITYLEIPIVSISEMHPIHPC